MPRSVGFFHFRVATPDDVWNQCDGPHGLHSSLRFLLNDRTADHLVCLGLPISPSGAPRHRGLSRRWSRLRGTYEFDRACLAFAALHRPPEDITVLFLEPASNIPPPYYAAAQKFARFVGAPDPRAPVPTRLPAWWWIDEPCTHLRAEPPPDDKPVPLACVTSGKTDLPGHAERLDFIRAARAAGIDVQIFGRNLPADLAPHVPVRSKNLALRPARFTLVLENDAAGDLYVSEKLWDPLLCWSLPIYHGSRAADSMIPTDAFIRLPDLGPAGKAVLRDTLANPNLWRERLHAIAEARRRILSDLRLVEWIRRSIPARP